jgi:hypothetical protein
MNGYVIRNVQLVEKNDSIMSLKGRDVFIVSPYSLFQSRDITDVKSSKPFTYELFSKNMHDEYLKNHIVSNDSLKTNKLVQTINGESITGIFLSSDGSSSSFQTDFGIVYIENNLIVSPKSSFPQQADQNSSLKNLVVVSLLNGESFQGEFISSTDSTATYQTKIGSVSIKKNDILSIKPLSNNVSTQVPKAEPLRTNKVLVKEYKNLPLLIITVGAGAWAVSLFGDASDYSKAADAFNILGLHNLADEANSESSTKLWEGIGLSAVAIAFLIWAVIPTETYIDQPVSIIPTSNGVRVAVHF